MRCPMCATEIAADARASACGSCPLHGWSGSCALRLVACPSCGYHALPSELRALQPKPIILTPPADDPVMANGPGDGTPLRQWRADSRGRVAGITGDPDIARRLIAYGVAPGADIELLQRVPTFIVRVNATELAFAAEIADDIRVAAV